MTKWDYIFIICLLLIAWFLMGCVSIGYHERMMTEVQRGDLLREKDLINRIYDEHLTRRDALTFIDDK